MPTISNAIVDAELRTRIFDTIIPDTDFVKINDRQYGILLTDLNGVQRYVRLGAIVAEERKDMSAADLMQAEIAEYNAKQAAKAEKAKARAEKAAKDKAAREAKAKEKEA